jgi:hypothetical protein
MPRRKLSRAERRERQAQREDVAVEDTPVIHASKPVRRSDKTSISLTGAAGAFLGASMFLALAVAVGAGAGEGPRAWGLVFAVIGLAFIPAIVVCVVPNHPRRDSVLRVTTVATMVLAFASIPVFGSLEFAVIMALPTTLIAIGAGFVMQGSGAKK